MPGQIRLYLLCLSVIALMVSRHSAGPLINPSSTQVIQDQWCHQAAGSPKTNPWIRGPMVSPACPWTQHWTLSLPLNIQRVTWPSKPPVNLIFVEPSNPACLKLWVAIQCPVDHKPRCVGPQMKPAAASSLGAQLPVRPKVASTGHSGVYEANIKPAWPRGVLWGLPRRHCGTTGSIILQPTMENKVGHGTKKFGNHCSNHITLVLLRLRQVCIGGDGPEEYWCSGLFFSKIENTFPSHHLCSLPADQQIKDLGLNAVEANTSDSKSPHQHFSPQSIDLFSVLLHIPTFFSPCSPAIELVSKLSHVIVSSIPGWMTDAFSINKPFTLQNKFSHFTSRRKIKGDCLQSLLSLFIPQVGWLWKWK